MRVLVLVSTLIRPPVRLGPEVDDRPFQRVDQNGQDDGHRERPHQRPEGVEQGQGRGRGDQVERGGGPRLRQHRDFPSSDALT
jgi:hypothetical protein